VEERGFSRQPEGVGKGGEAEVGGEVMEEIK